MTESVKCLSYLFRAWSYWATILVVLSKQPSLVGHLNQLNKIKCTSPRPRFASHTKPF